MLRKDTDKKKSKEKAVQADDAIQEMLERLRVIRNELKFLEEEKSGIIDELCIFMDDSDTLVDQSGVVVATYKSSKPTARFDSKAFKDEYPDLYEDFTVLSTVGNRPFLLKKEGE